MKKTFFSIIIYACLSLNLYPQRQLDIQGKSTSTDTVASIKVNYTGTTDVVGLAVTSLTQNGYSGTAGYFYGGENGIIGKSYTGVGVLGQSTNFHGLWGSSVANIAIYGQSNSHFGLYAESTNATGAFLYGGNGIALELGGADSPYGLGNDDSVIKTQSDLTSGDMILVANDNLHIHIDDKNSNTSELAIFNGTNTEIFSLDESGNLTLSGSCACSSDQNKKEHFKKINQHEILTKIGAMPITEWQFKGEQIRHIGPMAQDFHNAFNLGENETSISTTDGIGIALAAIQALKQEIESLQLENKLLRKMIQKLK